MKPIDIYILIGATISCIWIIGAILAIVRYAFHCIKHQYPNPNDIWIVPGISMPGDTNSKWIEGAFFTIVVSFPVVLLAPLFWPVGIIFICQNIISYSRKKRFG